MNNYQQRRLGLMESIEKGVVILFSGKSIFKSEDATYPFEVNRNFYYLTGLKEESMALVIVKNEKEIKEYLFILPYDEKLAKWVGGRILSEEAKKISGVLNIYDYEELDNFLHMTINRNYDNKDFYFDLSSYDADSSTFSIKYAHDFKEKYSFININNIYPNIMKMRLIKDEDEITCIKKAIAITNAGVKKMMTTIKEGVNEMSMEGVFDFVLAQNGCRLKAFDTICAGGKRGTILHYHDNNQKLQKGELLLCDLGATYDLYCADISRTFPVDRKFSERQKEIYEIVLNAQKIVEENAKPGVTLKQLNQLVIEYYKEELPKHGLNKDVSEYYYHGVSHFLGLDTHDIGSGIVYELQKGNVITNEPGLYIEDEEIGIRIEDDLLITENGCINLSISIPKKIEDIERIQNSI